MAASSGLLYRLPTCENANFALSHSWSKLDLRLVLAGQLKHLVVMVLSPRILNWASISLELQAVNRFGAPTSKGKLYSSAQIELDLETPSTASSIHILGRTALSECVWKSWTCTYGYTTPQAITDSTGVSCCMRNIALGVWVSSAIQHSTTCLMLYCPLDHPPHAVLSSWPHSSCCITLSTTLLVLYCPLDHTPRAVLSSQPHSSCCIVLSTHSSCCIVLSTTLLMLALPSVL
jgi:hypothetical protein